MPTFGSLFSGIGGLDLGLERAGWECRWQVEIDPFCRRVLQKHWPDVPKYTDVKVLDGSQLPAVDLVAGGFPCQPFSSAGKQVGTADARWLWPEFIRLVRLVRPRLVLVENVPGLLYRTGGMGAVLGDLAACGYDAEWDCVPASAVGAPHRRDRLWLIGYPHDEGQSVLSVDAEVAVVSGLGHTDGTRLERAGPGLGQTPTPRQAPACLGPDITRSTWWDAESCLDRVAHGVPARMDRLRALGNAVVPQVAQWIGRQLLTAMETA